MEKNERLREQYPPYRPSSNINIIHIHHHTNINIIEQLIQQAQTTHRYTIDTESEAKRGEPNVGALIQIEMVHSSSYSTVMLIETFHLADATSSLIDEIKKLWNIIFNSGNEIISWGPVRKEFKDFKDIEWVQIGKITPKNLQALFQDQEDEGVTHPATESRVVITGVSFDTPGDDYYYDDYNDNDYNDNGYYDDGSRKIKYSLQTAVIMKLNQFIDKSKTVGKWGCGLDPVLETWRTKLFQRKYYDRHVEQQTRRDMVNYAVFDCTTVTELYFTMYPEQINDIRMHVDHYSDISDDDDEIIGILSKQNPPPPPPTKPTLHDEQIIRQQPHASSTEPKPTRQVMVNDNGYDFSNMDEDELIERLKPRFDVARTVHHRPHHQPHHQPEELIITTTREEINELIAPEQPASATAANEKSEEEKRKERQRRKNEKYKEKKKYKPEFQNKLTRPIYYKYNYIKIRAQLLDDRIYTTHHVLINHAHDQVEIGFRSPMELEDARRRMRSNYFSINEYIRRWSGRS
jgi:hypothetical protein